MSSYDIELDPTFELRGKVFDALYSIDAAQRQLSALKAEFENIVKLCNDPHKETAISYPALLAEYKKLKKKLRHFQVQERSTVDEVLKEAD